jgi:mono/diheme cytochrome c family protein
MPGCEWEVSMRGLLICLVLFAGVWSNAQTQPAVRYIQPEYVSPADGAAMFRAYCAVCHGLDGRGGGPATEALKKRPADLTQLSRKNGGKFPVHHVDQMIQGADIEAAHGSRDMPIWGNVFRRLNDPALVKMRVDNLTSYLESLQRK